MFIKCLLCRKRSFNTMVNKDSGSRVSGLIFYLTYYVILGILLNLMGTPFPYT